MRRLTGFVFSLLLTAAAAGADLDPMPRFPEGTTAKIVVPLGDTLYVDRIGQTLFDNRHAVFDISDWKLGETLENSLAKIIARSGELRIEPLGDPQARIALEAANNYGNVAHSKKSKVKAAVKEYGAKSNADVLVVVNGFNTSDDSFFGARVSLHKFGIAELALFKTRTTIRYAMLTVLFYDARTGKNLAYAYHEAQEKHAQLPDDITQPPADLESLRGDFVHLVELGVARTIRDMIELRPEVRGSH